MQFSVLLVSRDEGLSRSRVLMLRQWKPMVALSDLASAAIEAKAYDLLILCQTVDDKTAAMLAEKMTAFNPASKVMVISRQGQLRRFGTVQYTLDLLDPSWLPKAVAQVLSA